MAAPSPFLHRVWAWSGFARRAAAVLIVAYGVRAGSNAADRAPVVLSGVPYINQWFDTADDFGAGEACCNATAALMAIQYYGRLPPRPISCSRGGPHTSDFGFYISNAYTFGDHTFDRLSSATWGAALAGFRGGFGYFLQDLPGDGLVRAERLAEYLRFHDVESLVDLDVAGERGFQKACAEIEAGHPVVLLVGLAPAGHYITCIGYRPGEHALICHDPAGNNASGYPNQAGAAVTYDWPGWNHGHVNLTAVPRLIYARAEPPSAPTFATHPISQWIAVDDTAGFEVTLAANVTADLQWECSTDRGASWHTITDDSAHSGATKSTLLVRASAPAATPCSYRCVARNGIGVANSAAADLVVRANAAEEAAARFSNVSVRAFCGLGANVAIVGFTITGPIPKAVLLRAVGPTLVSLGVATTEVLADPVLELHDARRADVTIGLNDNWNGSGDATALRTVAARVGALALADADSTSSALLVTLPPGGYTAVVRGKAGQTGVVLIEAYDAD